MVDNISICNQDSIFNWNLNIPNFKIKYPSVYKVHKNSLLEMDYFEILEIIPPDDNIEEITIKTESVILFLANGTKQKIFNTELMRVFGTTYCESWMILSDDQFVYFTLTIAFGQKGALAIWDMKKKSWIFSYTDEGFCVEAIVFSKKNNLFIGLSIWNYGFVNKGGEYFFIINKDNDFEQVELEEISDINAGLVDSDSCLKFLNFYNHQLQYEENNSIIIKIDKERRSFFYLNSSNC
jgi:hypothetical protein